MDFEKLKSKIKSDKKLVTMIILGIIGVILILASELTEASVKNDNANTQSKEAPEIIDSYEVNIENRLKEIISTVDGAGRVKVMITLKSGTENKYALNSVIESQSSEGKSQSKSDNEYVVVDSSTGDSCVLLRTDFPQVQGVVVVCDGGDNSKVKNDITNAVSSLLGININHISVLKMKQTEEK